jgi:hypothetical protein
MAAIFCCGFRCLEAFIPAPTGSHWINSAVTGSSDITPVTFVARSDGWAAQFTVIAGTAVTRTLVFTASSRWVGRLYLYFDTNLPTTSTSLVETSGGTTGPHVYFNVLDSKLYARVGTTSGASGVVVAADQWIRVDFDFNINTAGADFCDVQVDGTACGQATATGVSANPTQIQIGPSASTTVRIRVDDFILSNTAADYPFGAGNVYSYTPVSDGVHSIGGANRWEKSLTGTDITNSTVDSYLLIDDLPLPTTAGDFINMIAPVAFENVVHKFGPALGVLPMTTSPRVIEAIAAIHQAGTQTGTMRLALRGASSFIYYNGTGAGGSTSIVYKRGATTDADLASRLIAGTLEHVFDASSPADATPDQYLDAVLLEAEFAEVAAAFMPRKAPTVLQAVNRAGTF